MKTHIHLVTITIGLLSGALVYAGDKDSQNSKDTSQSGQSSAQEQQQKQQEQSSVQSEAAGAEKTSGQKITFNELPEPVQKTIRTHAGDLNVENIQKQMKNGQACYQATFDKDNMKGKLTVAEDGSLLQYQLAEDLALIPVVPQVSESGGQQLSDLPDAVQKAIKEQAGSEQVGNISKTSENGKTIYHAGFNQGGAHTDLFVNEDGKLVARSQETALFVAPLESSEKVALSSAPEAVQKTVREKAGSAQVADIDKGMWKGQSAYKVMIEQEGTTMALVISENGEILGQEISEAAGAEKKDQQQNEPQKEQKPQYEEKSKDQK